MGGEDKRAELLDQISGRVSTCTVNNIKADLINTFCDCNTDDYIMEHCYKLFKHRIIK